MLKIYNLKNKQEYIKEVAILTQKEWGKRNLSQDEFKNKIIKKVEKIKKLFNEEYYCKLILLNDNELIGFISIFPSDGDERKDLSPWYATMYVKEEYRGKGYSKILNNAILEEARKRNIKRLYLKTELENYYEKFGAQYLENLNKKEKLYYFNLNKEMCSVYNRISIVGGSGSGKSTLCNILSKELNLPAIHLDAINFNSNWVEIDKKERDKIIYDKSNEDKWIIDGNYNKTLKERFDRADLIIWLDYSTFSQLKGVLKRFFKTRNTERPEIPGCKERLNFTFIKYVVTYNKKKRHIVADYLKDIPKDKVLIFKKQRDLNIWLKEFTHNDNILVNLK